MNRALAREALGAQAAATGDASQAAIHFQEALQVCLSPRLGSGSQEHHVAFLPFVRLG
jgi:hypothetical protein